MIIEPRCFQRQCKHYLGVIQSDGTELTEVNSCKAFLKGIPNEIVYGNNLHSKLLSDQVNDIVFEKEK